MLSVGSSPKRESCETSLDSHTGITHAESIYVVPRDMLAPICSSTVVLARCSERPSSFCSSKSLRPASLPFRHFLTKATKATAARGELNTLAPVTRPTELQKAGNSRLASSEMNAESAELPNRGADPSEAALQFMCALVRSGGSKMGM